MLISHYNILSFSFYLKNTWILQKSFHPAFMSERGTGGDKCKRDKSCAKKGGKCVEAGTCDTIEISKMCHNKNSDACTCCAKGE